MWRPTVAKRVPALRVADFDVASDMAADKLALLKDKSATGCVSTGSRSRKERAFRNWHGGCIFHRQDIKVGSPQERWPA